MSVVAAAVIGSAVVGGVVASNAAGKAASAANKATDAAAAQATSQLEFDKAQYADQKPIIDALNKQALSTAQQDQQIAKDQADRSATAWQQNQNATQASVGQMGLNALGAQYLSNEDTAKLQQLQQILSSPTASPQARADAQNQISALQRSAEQAGIGLEQAKGQKVADVAAGQGQQVQAAYGDNAAATAALGQSYAQGLKDNAQSFGTQQIGLGDTTAGSILGDSGVIQSDLSAAGDARRADQTGFYNDQASQLKATAAQRAAAYEQHATEQANADIATSAGDAQRQLLRLGGDPNRMAAMAGDIANGQQLARIGAGNQIAKTNIANLNTADDQARGLEQAGFSAGTTQQYGLQNQAMAVKSSALDAARAARTTASQTALGLNMDAATQGLQATTNANQSAADKTLAGTTAGQSLTFAGQNQQTNIDNTAKDKVDANLNSLQQGAANFGAGFANTSGQAAQTAIAAGTAGTNGLNTAVQSPVGLLGVQNNAVGNINSAAGNSIKSADMIAQAGQTTAKAINSIGGLAGGYASGGTSGLMDMLKPTSSRAAKKDIRDVDGDAALAGLEDAEPKSWQYKEGEGDGGSHVGPIAEDMQKAFGDQAAPGGKKIDIISSLGLQHAAINALNKRLKQVEKRKGN